MSQTAILSGMYEELREYAELLDKVLVELKGGTSHPRDEKRKKLGQFLTELGSARTTSLTARLIGLLLKNDGSVAPQELARIGARLSSPGGGEVDRTVISRLEELARSLEQEQAAAMARMRGKEL
jgi:hypothetical protein